MPQPRIDSRVILDALDFAIGAAGIAATVVEESLRALDPPFVPRRLRPRSLVVAISHSVVHRGRSRRTSLTDVAVPWFDGALPVALDAVMKHLDPTDLVRRYVDLDELVAAVDLDAVAERLDVQAVVARVDLDDVATRLDVEAVLDRIDLTSTVLRRVDLSAVVEGAMAQLDVPALVGEVLDRIDLTSIVLGRVDLSAVAEEALAQVDVPALVGQVLDEIDLPEIIRESTGAMASDTVRSVRMQGVNADEAVGRLVERLHMRRSRPPSGGAAEG
jgi:hypothetical protein